MPCHPARARELVRKGKAVRRFNRGLFYIQLTEREDGDIQPIAVGIDPGSKKEAFTIKSEAHTYLYVGGYLKDRISLHSVATGKRLCQNAKPSDCRFLTFNTWRTRLLPEPSGRGGQSVGI
jgi:hypothetical protein